MATNTLNAEKQLQLQRSTCLSAERLLEAFAAPRDVAPCQGCRDAIAVVVLVSFDGGLEEDLLELTEYLLNPIVDSTRSARSKSKQGFRMKPRGVLKGVGVRK